MEVDFIFSVLVLGNDPVLIDKTGSAIGGELDRDMVSDVVVLRPKKESNPLPDFFLLSSMTVLSFGASTIFHPAGTKSS